jgi:hypothetical protein
MSDEELKVGDKVVLTKSWCGDRGYVGLHGIITEIKEPKTFEGGYIQVHFEVPSEKTEICYLGSDVKFPRFGGELRREAEEKK